MTLFAIWLPGILAMVGLLYSIGFIFVERRALQTAADAASAAACWAVLSELESSDRRDSTVFQQLDAYAKQEAGATYSAVYTDASGVPLSPTVTVGSSVSQFPTTARGVQVKVHKNVSIVLGNLIGLGGVDTAATSTAALVPTVSSSPAPVLPVAVNLTTDFRPAMATGATYDLLAPTLLPTGSLTPLLDFANSPSGTFATAPQDYGYSKHPPLSADPTGPSSIFTNLQFWSDGRHAPTLLTVPSTANLAVAPPPPLANSAFADPTNLTAATEQLKAYQDAFIAGLRDNIRQQNRVDASGRTYGLVVVPLWDTAVPGVGATPATVHVAGVATMRLRLADVTYNPGTDTYSAKGQFVLYPAAAWGPAPTSAPTPDVGARLVRLVA